MRREELLIGFSSALIDVMERDIKKGRRRARIANNRSKGGFKNPGRFSKHER